MVDVDINPPSLTMDDAFFREQACWSYWNNSTYNEKEVLMRTVKTELLRLHDTVGNWLPASARQKAGALEIRFTLYPEDLDPTIPPAPLTPAETAKLAGLLEQLEDIMKENADG